MRKLVGVVLAAGLLATLSACASAPLANSNTFSSCTSGGNAALVTSKGKIGDDPKSAFPTPLVAKKSELAVTTKGDGKQITPDDGVNIVISLYDGETGDPVADSDGSSLTTIPLQEFVTGRYAFTEALSCATVGSRVVVTGTGAVLLPAATDLADQTLVVVIDVESSFLGKASGADQVPQAGYPSVVLAPNGRPGLTFSGSEVPDGLGAIALKQGGGAKVAKSDIILANITGVVWGADSTFLSTWDGDAPALASVADDSGLLPGLTKAIIGQKVGSQLLVVLSGDDGYPAGSEPDGVTAGDTVVFVVDILGISK